MLRIKVLGPGCHNCFEVEKVAGEALELLQEEQPGLEATLQHVSDPGEFQRYMLLFTPGLVVNDKLVCAGRIPSVSEAKSWFLTSFSVDA